MGVTNLITGGRSGYSLGNSRVQLKKPPSLYKKCKRTLSIAASSLRLGGGGRY
jgi:hypothetical protein